MFHRGVAVTPAAPAPKRIPYTAWQRSLRDRSENILVSDGHTGAVCCLFPRGVGVERGGRTSRSSSSSITIGSDCTPPWVTDLRKNLSGGARVWRQTLEVRRWSFSRTKRTRRGLLQGCW